MDPITCLAYAREVENSKKIGFVDSVSLGFEIEDFRVKRCFHLLNNKSFGE